MQEYSKKNNGNPIESPLPQRRPNSLYSFTKIITPVIFLIKKHFLSLISDLLILCPLFLLDFCKFLFYPISISGKHDSLTR